MSADRYVCCDERRRTALADPSAPAGITGIDYLEVAAGATTADPTVITVHLVKPLPQPAADLSPANFALTGGVRFPPPKIAGVQMQPGGGSVERYAVTIAGNQPTDFSTYRLALVKGPDNRLPPDFIDPRLSEVDFSFKVECPGDFDCADECNEPQEAGPPDPDFDYRARDYQGFRRQLLDRIAALVPGFRQDDPADFTTTLVEAAAYRLDQQSYRLDWVGTEAFLDTARSRTSIRRHARLVDYSVGEGSSARVFVRFGFRPGGAIADGLSLARSTPLMVRAAGVGPVVPARLYRRVLAQDPVIFETVAELRLWAWRSAIAIHTWGDASCTLPKGATAATLEDLSGGGPAALAPGDFLLFEEIASPETGRAEDARRDRRHVVRLVRATPVTDVLAPGKFVTVEWGEEDAMPFDLTVSAANADTPGGAGQIVCSRAAGNVMLADHGASAPPPLSLALPNADMEALGPRLEPSEPAEGAPWRPRLDRRDVARIHPAEIAAVPAASAAALMRVDPGACVAAVELHDAFASWSARRDLLRSSPFSREFVVETAIDGRLALRFGDGVEGYVPSAGTRLVPSGRFGFGPEGNVGPGAIAHLVVPDALEGAVITVDNPLSARGGTAPESATQIRIAAPEAFRTQLRAVTAADYAAAAMRHPQVSNAVAVARWTGAWQTILVYVDRKEGRPVDERFRKALLAHLEGFRLMGFDVAIRGVRPAPLLVELLVCVEPGQLRSEVAIRVRDALRPAGAADGSPGFFHPDNFTFGAPLYLSALVAAVMAVDGVQSVQPLKFQRMDRPAGSELALGVIRPGALEALQLSDDPSFPEQGRLGLSMGGGR